MRYVITGATSFIGVELINHLLQRGNTVFAVCRSNSGGLAKISSAARIVYADMAEYGKLDKQIEEADIFVNLAWKGSGHEGRNVTSIQEENVAHVLAAMNAAKSMGCKVFAETGSQAEYGTVTSPITEETPCRPFSEYGKAKLETKNRCFELSEEIGMKYIHLRVFSVFGEGDHPCTLIMSSIDKMLANEPVDLSPCTQNWNFLYVKDAVTQIQGLCEYAINRDDFKHEVYNVASKDTRQLKDFIETMKWMAHSGSELRYGVIKPGNLASLQPDVTKTQKAIGLVNFHSFENVIARMIAIKRQKA